MDCSVMKPLCVIFVFFWILRCSKLEQVWHSYQTDPTHQSREELVITNITSADDFDLDYAVTKWKSLCSEKMCHLVGLAEKGVVFVSLKLSEKKATVERVEKLDFENPLDAAILQYWNVTCQKSETIAVIALKSELLWYKVNENKLFWSWSPTKNISHINVFQIESEHHLLIVNQHLSRVTADLYQFELKEPNFWLRQKLELAEVAASSAVTAAGSEYFISIPQKSLSTLLIYKLADKHFTSYKNITSKNIDQVVTFKIGQKSFLAINGLNAGIYRFGADLTRENIAGSHTEGVNYWLPIPLTIYGDDTVLIAQRSLKHGIHKSFVIEVFTYNGQIFEEHEDIPCFYFGEETLGLSCLVDEEGIKGSTSVFQNVLGLMIPRKNRSSEFFLVEAEAQKVSSPLEKQIQDFSVTRRQISELLSIQGDRYKKLLRQSSGPFILKERLEELERAILDLKQRFSSVGKTDFDKVVFTKVVQIKKSGTFNEVLVEKINGEIATPVFGDIALKNNLGVIKGDKTFKHLETQDLIVEKINDVEAKNLLFQSSDVKIEGDVLLTKPLTVLGDVSTSVVNGLIFEEEVIDLKNPVDELVFRDLEIAEAGVETVNKLTLPINIGGKFDPDHFTNHSLFTPHNVQVSNINGYPFNQLLTELCLKNIKNSVPGLKIQGDVTVLESAEIDSLNNLRFPDEYVFLDDSFQEMTGVKHFSTLVASDVTCEGTVDNIDPSQVITLSTNQSISGVTTFKNLKITESLNVDGKILGEHASKFLPNPTLLETNLVKSKVHFKNLEVDGAIVVENFNGKNLDHYLSDVVYVTENKIVIEAMKQFPEGFTTSNLLVSSNSVNNVSLDSIVTKNSEQILDLKVINGVVDFGNVEIEGLYDSTDVRKLDEELVKLDGEQYISSTLIFEELDVKTLEVDKTLKNSSRDFRSDEFEVESVVVEGDFKGAIGGFDLKSFDTNRMSYTRSQRIGADFNLEEAFIGNLVSGRINNVDSTEMTSEACEEKLISRMKEGLLEVKDLIVKNSLEIEKINNQSALNLGGSFWNHDVKKYNMTHLEFKGDVYFNSVTIEKLSSVNFNKYIRSIVFKNETDVILEGHKTFLEGLTVKKLIETEELNNIALPNILTKQGAQTVSSPVTVSGNVSFQNVEIANNIGNVPVDHITNIYQFSDGRFIIKGEVLFDRLAHIRDLDIQGHVGNNRAQEVIDGIVYKDGDFALSGLTTFENEIKIDKNVRVTGEINGVNLPAFVSDMVMITKDGTVKAPTRFSEEVEARLITVHKKVTSENLNDINLKSWVEEAIFINRGILEGNFLFDNVTIVDSLRTESLKNIKMQTLVPLRSAQTLPNLSFESISLFKDVAVGNSTNHINLATEFANSVLINSDQDIDSNVQFMGKVFVEGDLEVFGLLNEVEPSRLVTTNTDQELSAGYTFKSKVNLEGDLVVEGLVNGVDVEKWARDAVLISSDSIQNVTDNWNVEDLVFEEETKGNGLVNAIDFKTFSQEIVEKRDYKYQIEKGFIDDYLNICKDLTFMHQKLQKQIYKFDYLETLQTLNFQKTIDHIHQYTRRNQTFLLVSERKNCQSYLFLFDSRFRYLRDVHLGRVAQIISVRVNDLTYLVVRNQPFYSTCKVQGTFLWQVVDNGFVNPVAIEDQDLLQESLVAGTFYGLKGHVVTEFRVLPDLDLPVRKYRRWEVKEENLAFVPRGLGTGLSLRSGRKLIRLHRDDPISEDFSADVENIIIGNFTENFNAYLPGRKAGDLAVMTVGIKSSKRNLLAVASHEETSVKGSLDFIKIYEDANTGKVFHKVPTYKPSSLAALEFNNGETLLAFMEDGSVLQMYEYKGIEGFKHKLSAKLAGSDLFVMSVEKERKIVGLIDRNKVVFMDVVMLGNRVQDNLHCSL